jgi:hypothetical protein
MKSEIASIAFELCWKISNSLLPNFSHVTLGNFIASVRDPILSEPGTTCFRSKIKFVKFGHITINLVSN